MFIYLKMRKPSAIPNARTHIPISNGGQLQIRERKSSCYQIQWPVLPKERQDDNDNDNMGMSPNDNDDDKEFTQGL